MELCFRDSYDRLRFRHCVADASPCVADPVPPANCASGLIIASISTSYLLVLLGLTIAIVGQFSALPVINTLLPSLLRGSALAGGVALYNTMAQFGGFFGPIAIGVLKEETNGYAAGLIVLAVAVTSSAVVVLALGRALSPSAASASVVRT